MIITRLPDPPQEEIITFDEVMEFCRVDVGLNAYSQGEMEMLRDAAIETGEQETGMIWRAAEYEITMGGPASSPATINIPICPVTKMDSIVFFDGAGAELLFGPDDYLFFPSDMENRRPWSYIRLLNPSWRDVKQVKLKITAGWGKEQLPKALKAWVLNRIASMNERRGDMHVNVTSAPRKHIDRLLDRYRVMGRPKDG